MFDLTERIALVTGAATGLGEAVAKQLAKAGASMYLTNIDGAAAKVAADGIGSPAEALALDVTDPSSRILVRITAGEIVLQLVSAQGFLKAASGSTAAGLLSPFSFSVQLTADMNRDRSFSSQSKQLQLSPTAPELLSLNIDRLGKGRRGANIGRAGSVRRPNSPELKTGRLLQKFAS